MLLQIHGQLVGYHAVHQGADGGVAQLGLGLSLELGLRQLHGDHGGDALPDVLAGDLVALLDHAVFHAIGVQHPGQGRFEARLVHAALGGVDVVGEGHQGLVIAVVILQGNLGGAVALGPRQIDDLLMQRRLVAVEPGNKFPDASLVAHGVTLLLAGPGVGNGDTQPRIQERLLPHPGVQRFIVIHQGVEHLRIRLEGNGGAGLIGVAQNLHLLGDAAPGELHLVNSAVLLNLHLQPFGQGIDHGRAHAVEAAGYLIASAAELTAGVEHGVYHLQRRPAGLLLDVHGDAAAVIGNGDGVARVDGDGDLGAVSGQCLVNGVVHDLIHQMVQARGRCGANIHAGPLAHRLQPLQNLNFRGVIGGVHGGDFFQFAHWVIFPFLGSFLSFPGTRCLPISRQ